jgi:hypothetical protein
MTDCIQVDEPKDEAAADTVGPGSVAALQHFLATSAACRVAASILKNGAEVGVTFTDVEGDWHVRTHPPDGTSLEAGKAADPDFELRIPPAAGAAIFSHTDSDVGQLGVKFFEHIASKNPDLRINVVLRSGLLKLSKRGWLALLTRGGPAVMMWMAKKGFRGPGAIATALGRLKK